MFISKLYEDAELRRQFGADSKALINKKANFDQNLGEQFFKVLADKNFIPKNN
ncbi:MAG: hypothetical protein MRK02_15880 [Candidatus Scalindua sp.]|nr:hypothetical protein [Candidatus Scalindua sp.]